VKNWDAKEQNWQIVDPGVTDKRLMITEAEFASALSVADRPGNTVSPLVRKAWDGVKLNTLTLHSRLCATAAHISVVGHITEEELRSRITRTDMANGFANRFLFALIKALEGTAVRRRPHRHSDSASRGSAQGNHRSCARCRACRIHGRC